MAHIYLRPELLFLLELPDSEFSPSGWISYLARFLVIKLLFGPVHYFIALKVVNELSKTSLVVADDRSTSAVILLVRTN